MGTLPVEVSTPPTRGPSSIDCQVSGIPTPTVYWTTINDISVRENSTNYGVYQTLREHVATLHIENATGTDDGVYICFAKNIITLNDVPEEFMVSDEIKLRGKYFVFITDEESRRQHLCLFFSFWSTNNHWSSCD